MCNLGFRDLRLLIQEKLVFYDYILKTIFSTFVIYELILRRNLNFVSKIFWQRVNNEVEPKVDKISQILIHLPYLRLLLLQNTCRSYIAGYAKLITLHLNEKFLSTKPPWDFDANLEISDSNWSISDPKFFYRFTGLAVNPG